MVLGIEILLHNIPKMILLVLISAVLGILMQTLITWLSFAIIRRYASGLHAKNSITCTIYTLAMFIVVPYALRGVYIHLSIVILVFAFITLALYRYAPADTKSRPILGKKKRALLKRKALISCGFLLVLIAVPQFEAFRALITVGAVYAAMAVLPATYKLLGRSMKNYEQYE